MLVESIILRIKANLGEFESESWKIMENAFDGYLEVINLKLMNIKIPCAFSKDVIETNFKFRLQNFKNVFYYKRNSFDGNEFQENEINFNTTNRILDENIEMTSGSEYSNQYFKILTKSI